MPGMIFAINSVRAMNSISSATPPNRMTNMEGLLQIWKGYKEVSR